VQTEQENVLRILHQVRLFCERVFARADIGLSQLLTDLDSAVFAVD